MNRILLSLAALAALSGTAYAAETIRLCTGGPSGNYYGAGETIRQMAGSSLDIVVVETQGTVDNMRRMIDLPATDPAACDAMIGQPDGPVYLARTAAAKAKRVRQIASLHREYLHVLCNKDSGVDDLGDLESDPAKYKLAIGDEGSGAWLIWQNLIVEDEDYAAIPVSSEGGIMALSAIQSGDATCMLVPAGLKNGDVTEADNNFGDTVQLVGANDKDFDDAIDIKGQPLYTYAKIPGSAYPTSFNYWSDVSTISWLAGVYINPDRIKDKKVLTAFVHAATRAATTIKAEYGK